MVLKSSSVALLTSSLLACNVSAAELNTNEFSVFGSEHRDVIINTDVIASFKRDNERSGIYILQLTEKSVLDKSYASLGSERGNIVAVIDKQQKSVIEAIKAIDPGAIVVQKVRMVDNLLRVQMTHVAADNLASHKDIAEVIETAAKPTLTDKDEFKPYPYLKINDSGGNVTVAIVGNGVDYTHEALGGQGTLEAYAQAWKNKSNAWDGFPTETVIGGLDFAAGTEGYHTVDYNPIENSNDPIAVDHSYFYPSGTAQASIILDNAPKAKLLAYKTLDYNWDYFSAAMDVVVDPNQDGDLSDRPDIILVNSFGSGAFYQAKGAGRSYETLQIDHMRRLAGLGSLLISPAGTFYRDTYYGSSAMGSTPEALTVGAVKLDGEQVLLSDFTPAGPTRGDTMLKPDVVAISEGFEAARAGSGKEKASLARTSAYAAASAAGVAARVWNQHKHLSALEVKALVTNTARAHNIQGIKETVVGPDFTANVTKVPEVPFIGSGLVSVDNIDKAKAILWETGTYQPSLAFGFISVANKASERREITLKNISNQPQTYNLSLNKLGEKNNNAAVSMIFPETVSVPANSAITFPVTLTIDAQLLAQFQMNSTSDYTIENWAEASVNGFIEFTNTDETAADSQLKLPWLVFPKKETAFYKSNANITSSRLYQSEEFNQKLLDSSSWVESRTIDIANTGNEARTLMTLPLMHHKYHPSEAKADLQGHIIQSLGATIYEVSDEQCPSGNALAVSIEMFDPFELAMAEHRDRHSVLAHWTIYSSDFADQYGDNPYDAEKRATDEDKLAYMLIELNGDGKPVLTYTDLSMEFDYWNPAARFKESTLDTFVSPGGKTAIANICMDSLFRDEYPDLSSWNKTLGWQFATDRDAVSPVNEAILRFNPILGGIYKEEIIDHTGETGYPNWWDTWTPCEAKPWDENYCIENASKLLAGGAAAALLSSNDSGADNLDWKSLLVVPAGHSARVAAGVTMECDPNTISTGPFVIDSQCPPGVAIYELGNNNSVVYPELNGVDTIALKGQSFTVYENSPNGTVVGQIEVSSPSFFVSETNEAAKVFLMNSLPGTPFAVSTAGEVSVINSDTLDYESLNKSYVLEIQVDHVNRADETVDVVINVTNINDVAPIQTSSIDVVKGEKGEALSTNISSFFTETEGDGISFFSENFPEGLALSRAGDITGIPKVAGNFTANFVATDGINQLNASVDISISSSDDTTTNAPSSDAPQKELQSQRKSSAGSFGLLTLLLAGFVVNKRVSRK